MKFQVRIEDIKTIEITDEQIKVFKALINDEFQMEKARYKLERDFNLKFAKVCRKFKLSVQVGRQILLYL
jgi:hypothetical protein